MCTGGPVPVGLPAVATPANKGHPGPAPPHCPLSPVGGPGSRGPKLVHTAPRSSAWLRSQKGGAASHAPPKLLSHAGHPPYGRSLVVTGALSAGPSDPMGQAPILVPHPRLLTPDVSRVLSRRLGDTHPSPLPGPKSTGHTPCTRAPFKRSSGTCCVPDVGSGYRK